MATVSAGGVALPPYYIFKGIEWKDEWKAHAAATSIFNMQEKGYLDGKLFTNYVRWLVSDKGLPQTRPHLILVDGYYAHENLEAVEIAMKEQVYLFAFPSHSTAFLQPLDVVIFGELKRRWKLAVAEYLKKILKEK